MSEKPRMLIGLGEPGRLHCSKIVQSRAQMKFYFIPKERVANILDWETRTNPDGSIISSNGSIGLSRVTLSDYLIPSNIVSTPTMSAYVGKIGTKAELYGDDYQYFRKLKKDVDGKLKQYEI